MPSNLILTLVEPQRFCASDRGTQERRSVFLPRRPRVYDVRCIAIIICVRKCRDALSLHPRPLSRRLVITLTGLVESGCGFDGGSHRMSEIPWWWWKVTDEGVCLSAGLWGLQGALVQQKLIPFPLLVRGSDPCEPQPGLAQRCQIERRSEPQ